MLHPMPDPEPDPRPIPPEPPLPTDCCDSGCERCVYDIYADDLALYRERLAQWRERHPGTE
jgi:hypothetical protein